MLSSRRAVVRVPALLLTALLVATARPPTRFNSTPTSFEPIVFYCRRSIKDEAAYKEAFSAAQSYSQARCPGCKAMFAYMDRTKPNTAIEFSWYDSVADLSTRPQDPELAAALRAQYAGTTETDWCQTFGGWTPALVEMGKTRPDVWHVFQPPTGFLRWVAMPRQEG